MSNVFAAPNPFNQLFEQQQQNQQMLGLPLAQTQSHTQPQLPKLELEQSLVLGNTNLGFLPQSSGFSQPSVSNGSSVGIGS